MSQLDPEGRFVGPNGYLFPKALEKGRPELVGKRHSPSYVAAVEEDQRQWDEDLAAYLKKKELSAAVGDLQERERDLLAELESVRREIAERAAAVMVA